MKYHHTQTPQERVILVGLTIKPNKKEDTEAHLRELAFLAETAGAKTVEAFIQQLPSPIPATFVGSGFLENLKEFIAENEIDTAIFDDELSPSQLRNIERILGCKILDRTNLILDIFATRARTSHARIQVELAQYQYLLPRLAGRWTHLERQQGGIGLRGPGETEIETDRRLIRDKISHLKKQLVQIDKQKSLQRQHRDKLVRVALVGYTNSGKSTILNLLSKADVLVENKLFATLDTTVRKVVIDKLPFLLADTVGFIHKLPHYLVESFKATLDEVREADLLLHIIDISHPRYEMQIHVVNKTLKEIDAHHKPIIKIFNKVDALPEVKGSLDPAAAAEAPGTGETPDAPGTPGTPGAPAAAETTGTPTGTRLVPTTAVVNPLDQEISIYISAVKKINIDLFRSELYKRVKEIHITRWPYNAFFA